MKFLFAVALIAILSCGAGTPPASKTPVQQMERMSDERFFEIRTILHKTTYPVAREALIRRLGGPDRIKWVFDTARGKDAHRKHFTYYATEPEIPYGGGFCIEMEVATRNEGPTDIVVAATICFVSRFGPIYYERPES